MAPELCGQIRSVAAPGQRKTGATRLTTSSGARWCTRDGQLGRGGARARTKAWSRLKYSGLSARAGALWRRSWPVGFSASAERAGCVLVPFLRFAARRLQFWAAAQEATLGAAAGTSRGDVAAPAHSTPGTNEAPRAASQPPGPEASSRRQETTTMPPRQDSSSDSSDSDKDQKPTLPSRDRDFTSSKPRAAPSRSSDSSDDEAAPLRTKDESSEDEAPQRRKVPPLKPHKTTIGQRMRGVIGSSLPSAPRARSPVKS